MPLFERLIAICLIAIPLLLACAGTGHISRASFGGATVPVANSRKYYTSVVRLHTVKKAKPDETGSQATGFAISTTHMVTAGHFCDSWQEGLKEGQYTAELLVLRADYDGSVYEIGKAVLVARDPEHDLCMIESKEELPLQPLPLLGDMSVLETEDNITVLGAPKGYFPVRRDGFIISTTSPRFAKEDMLFLAVDIQKGSSGSPVLWNGFVIGVIAILPFNIHDAGLAVRGDHLLDFVNRNMKEKPEEK